MANLRALPVTMVSQVERIARATLIPWIPAPQVLNMAWRPRGVERA
jgi:hypothetical protein